MRGRVLVVGGGVAGLQAAIDLARLGHEVVLAERRPHVGGKLRELERTFPSDDCSLCRLAPTGCFVCVKSAFPPTGFPGLRVLTDTEVVALAGEPGRFLATLRANREETGQFSETFEAIILAPGCSEYDPSFLERLRYGRHPDVLIASRYEGMLAGGELRRPSDGEPVRRVAWVQCVGARDSSLNRPLCSAVCCGYALKQAAVTRQLSGGAVQTTIFAQDLRTADLFLDRYARRVIEEHRLRLIRHRVHSVDVDEEGRLAIRFAAEDGNVSAETFDLVVLSVGLEPDPGAGKLARDLGLELDDQGFCLAAPEPGVFVAGSFSEPKDVRGSLVQASAAAAACASFLASRGQQLSQVSPELLPDTLVPAVALCQCHRASAGDYAAEVKRRLGTWPQVGEVTLLEGCLLESRETGLRDVAARHRQLVIGACEPRVCEAAARALLAAPGVSLRVAPLYASAAPGGAGVGEGSGDAGGKDCFRPLPLESALSGLRAALTPTPSCPPVEALPRYPSVLIVGGGPAGLACALGLAGLGFPCHLVEKEPRLGGRALGGSGEAFDPGLRRQLQELADRVRSHPLITVWLGWRVSYLRREEKGWRANLTYSGTEEAPPVRCGAVVVAAGGEAFSTAPPHLPAAGDVLLTLPELEERIAAGLPLAEGGGPVVILLCGEDTPPGYCSKVCCQQAVRCALALKTRSPSPDVLVLFRDLRTPGRAELAYNEARRRGARFVRLAASSPPHLERVDGRLVLTYLDPVLAEQVTVFPAVVAFSAAVVPSRELDPLAAALGIPRDEQGFVQARHPKLAPTETPLPGVFACGSVSAPATAEEALAQGMAAATRVAIFLRERRAPFRVARITGACSACLTCLRVCRAGAVQLGGGKPRLDPWSCRGCGICAAECPAQAIVLTSSCASELEARMEAALQDGDGEGEARWLVLACGHCAATALERVRASLPPGARVLEVPCLGAVGETIMLKAFSRGARELVLAGCREDQCQYGAGWQRARARAQRVRKLLAQAGVRGEVAVLELTPERAALLTATLLALGAGEEARVGASGD